MAAATGLTVIKKMTYRGDATEEYSNTYWFTGTPPANSAAWRTLFDAVVAIEKTVYLNSVSVIRGYGYADDTGHKPGDTGAVTPAAWSVDLSLAPETPVAGTLAIGSGALMPGDAAVWVRWKTSRLTSPGGKPIYLRKYFHVAVANAVNAGDTILTAQRTALLALGAKMYDGTLSGSRTLTTAGQTDVITAHNASTYITTRSLKRRGKRAT